MTTKTETTEGTVAEYVTAVIGGQLFGLPISRVQDVFMPERLTRVPLSSGEIAGVLNLRGRIVTVVDMRARLGLPKNDDGKPPMAVGVDLRGESYGLLIDQIEWMYERYGLDEEWPATGRMADWSQSMLPCNFCGWKSDCPAWAGELL